MDLLTFQECPTMGYSARTFVNASADITIAIAEEFRTPGENCTKKAVIQHRKLYAPMPYGAILEPYAFGNLIHQIMGYPAVTINIAGNGIYTLKKTGDSQALVDSKVCNLLTRFVQTVYQLGYPRIELIRTGGQTGIDEAGAKAGVKLGIPTLVYAPKGWLFRNEQGVDIADEAKFKARFKDYVGIENVNVKANRTPNGSV